MELFIFARFDARGGHESRVADLIAEVVTPTAGEIGCLSVCGYRATGDGRVFFIRSQWANEAAFDHHAGLAHTVRFLEEVRPLLARPSEIVRTRAL